MREIEIPKGETGDFEFRQMIQELVGVLSGYGKDVVLSEVDDETGYIAIDENEEVNE